MAVTIKRDAILLHEAAHAVVARILGRAVVAIELAALEPGQPHPGGPLGVVWCACRGDEDLLRAAFAGPFCYNSPHFK
jgi:hypothetical protein